MFTFSIHFRNMRYFILLSVLISLTFAQHNHSSCTKVSENPYFFVANKGQFAKDLLAKSSHNRGYVALKKDRIQYLFFDNNNLHDRFFHGGERNNTLTTDAHVYDVIFHNANPIQELVQENTLEEYHNYFLGNDPSKWAGKVPLFKDATYKN